jgi:hypothetical protein
MKPTPVRPSVTIAPRSLRARAQNSRLILAICAASILTFSLLAHSGPVENPESKDLWSLKPMVLPEIPKVQDAKGVRNPIDNFVLAKLEEKGLTLSPEADRLTLIRRLSFDLIGLPPTPEEIDAFVKDKSKDAYEKLVDRLLASPRYGERWGAALARCRPLRRYPRF